MLLQHWAAGLSSGLKKKLYQLQLFLIVSIRMFYFHRCLIVCLCVCVFSSRFTQKVPSWFEPNQIWLQGRSGIPFGNTVRQVRFWVPDFVWIKMLWKRSIFILKREQNKVGYCFRIIKSGFEFICMETARNIPLEFVFFLNQKIKPTSKLKCRHKWDFSVGEGLYRNKYAE